jgi:tetratricopeptide (TPR) repeat protein
MKKKIQKVVFLVLCFSLIGLFACKSEIEKKAEAKVYFDQALSKNEDYKGAVDDYTKSIELNPKYQLAYHNRANAKRMLGDYTGAIKDCDKALELGNEYAGVYYIRGLSKHGLGDTQGALEDLNRAGKLGMPEAYDKIKEIQKVKSL